MPLVGTARRCRAPAQPGGNNIQQPCKERQSLFKPAINPTYLAAIWTLILFPLCIIRTVKRHIFVLLVEAGGEERAAGAWAAAGAGGAGCAPRAAAAPKEITQGKLRQRQKNTHIQFPDYCFPARVIYFGNRMFNK